MPRGLPGVISSSRCWIAVCLLGRARVGRGRRRGRGGRAAGPGARGGGRRARQRVRLLRRVLVVRGRLLGRQDVLLGARVDLDVERQVLDRLGVARKRVDVVDRPVVPVVQQPLPARDVCLAFDAWRSRVAAEAERRAADARAPRRCRMPHGAEEDGTKQGLGYGAQGSRWLASVRDVDESSGRAYAPGCDCVRRSVAERTQSGPNGSVELDAAGTRTTVAARPSSRAHRRAALFFGARSGRRVAAVARARGGGSSRSCSSPRGARRSGCSRLVPLAALAVWCAVSIAWSVEPDRSWSYANRDVRLSSPSRSSARCSAPTRGACSTGSRALLGAVCIWALAGQGAPLAVRGLRADRPAARARSGTGTRSRCSATSRSRSASAWRPALRVAGTLLVFGWIVAIGLTYSRGGVAVARRRRRALDGLLATPGSRASRRSSRPASRPPARSRSPSRSPGSRATARRTTCACATALVFGVVLAPRRGARSGARALPASRHAGSAPGRASSLLARGRRGRASVPGSRRAPSAWRSFTRLDELRADELAGPPDRLRVELPLGLVEAGLAAAGRQSR